ncbi:hypothetical protein [Stenotrophomonas rhizophila]|uniref:hypothetical protein n=1 Tax=Stenotrophomonas rhizophila TaxID=216778 RepID=UPI0028AA7BAD|nr:hypothetical protein [Stenotrophomonas rhizophila]
MSPIASDKLVTRTGEVAGAQYIVNLNVWPEGDTTIEAIVAVVGGQEHHASYSGFVFVSEEAAMIEAIQTVKSLAGSDDPRTVVAGVKSIWGSPVGR